MPSFIGMAYTAASSFDFVSFSHANYSILYIMPKLEIKKRVIKECVICGKSMKVIIYMNRSYRGGHYFGKIPVFSKKELKKAYTFGTHTSVIAGHSFQVMNKDPKTYRHFEYWECPKCYWGGE